MKQISEEKAHAKFSASGAARWLNCPGSIALCEKAPEARESEYAAEGTKAHECLEFLLKNKNRLREATKVALKNYDPEMVEHALTAIHWIISEMGEGDVLLCETKVDSSPFTCTGQFGTLDAAIVREFGKLTVIDYKYGAGVGVDPEYNGDCNEQLAYYALGISYEYHHNFAEVELVVIQPRAYHESGEVIRKAVFPTQHILSWGKRFREGVMATGEKNAPLKTGSWCRFCPAATICPEKKDKAIAQAQIVFADTGELVSVPEPKMIILPQLSEALDACERLEDWIQKVREHAVHVLERGVEIPGFKLVWKRGVRRWFDSDEAEEKAKAKFGIDAFNIKLMSPAQLEKKFGKGEAIVDFISEHMTDQSSGTTLVRESDKRPAVLPAAEVFKLE